MMYSCVLGMIVLCFNHVVGDLIGLMLFGTAVAAGGGWYEWDFIKDKTYCRFAECCNDHYIPYDLDLLKQNLDDRMFGQPLVTELVNILSAQKEAVNKTSVSNEKALVISLHGWTGVGKNYATTMIADALYRKGMHSNYVKMFMGERDFGCNDLNNKKKHLMSTLNDIVKKCPRSLIIFDEIEKMCPSVLDAIKPMLDHHHKVDGVDYRDSVFIFISNIGGQDIATHLLDLLEEGITRDEVEFHDFEPLIRRRSYFEGGFKESNVIAHHLIDHYVPFLPLEQRHVEQCALWLFRQNGVQEPTEQMMTDALSVITYGPTEDRAIFANSGCKRLIRTVPYVVKKFANKEKSSHEL